MKVLLSDTIETFPASAWNACFSDELEDWAYYRAVEQAGLPGFAIRYLAVQRGEQLICCAPAFLTSYRLDTTIGGPLRRITGLLEQLTPGILSLKMLCLGSPVAERCHVGLKPNLLDQERMDCLAVLLRGMEQLGQSSGARLMAVKDVPIEDLALRDACRAAGYSSMPGLPTAINNLAGLDEDGYLKTLSRSTRKDIRRKLRGSSGIRVEHRHAIDDVLGQVAALYDETRQRAELQFEELPANYFSGLLSAMPQRASCFLYWISDQLVAFNLVLHSDSVLIDKYIGMRYPLARDHNLYFVSWIANIRFCCTRGIPRYQSGQGGYAAKRHLGCEFLPNELYFRHRFWPMNQLLRLVSRIVRPDNFDSNMVAQPGVRS